MICISQCQKKCYNLGNERNTITGKHEKHEKLVTEAGPDYASWGPETNNKKGAPLPHSYSPALLVTIMKITFPPI